LRRSERGKAQERWPYPLILAVLIALTAVAATGAGLLAASPWHR
jgi:hypothetical protein